MTLADQYLTDREIYGIEEINGEKYVHFRGYGYPNEEEEGFIFVHRIGAVLPLAEVIERIEKDGYDELISDIDNDYKQYQDEVDSLYDYVGDVANCDLENLTMAIPIGEYETK